jgi:magnesium chelatase family protein
LVSLVSTAAYLGLEARAVEVQCQIAPGMPAFALVGLPDKAVGESRQRVQAALAAMGLSLPPKRITINLSPADLPKEGSHYDLPIALALLAAMGVTDAELLADYIAVGELALDGRIIASPGVLLAALHASGNDKGLICPAAQGTEAMGQRYLDPCRARSHQPAQPFERHASAAATRAGGGRAATARARPCASQRPGSCQARAGNRRGRRTQPALVVT